MEFLYAPNIRVLAADWAQLLYQSERTFSRFFRSQTGMAFVEWRQHACLIAALARLAEGRAVTAVALELGYDSPGNVLDNVQTAPGIQSIRKRGLNSPLACDHLDFPHAGTA